MTEKRTFKSTSTDTSYPWKVFFATTALYFITYNLWAITGNKESHVFIWINACSWIPGFLLAKFIQKLKKSGANPPITVSEEGLHINQVLGGPAHVPWNQIKAIGISDWEDHKRHIHPAILIEVFSDQVKLKVKKYYIIEDLLADGLDELVECIEPYHHVSKKI